MPVTRDVDFLFYKEGTTGRTLDLTKLTASTAVYSQVLQIGSTVPKYDGHDMLLEPHNYLPAAWRIKMDVVEEAASSDAPSLLVEILGGTAVGGDGNISSPEVLLKDTFDLDSLKVAKMVYDFVLPENIKRPYLQFRVTQQTDSVTYTAGELSLEAKAING